MQNLVDNSPKIKVVIRKRPLSKKEIQNKEIDIIEVLRQQSVIVRELKSKVDLTKYTEENVFSFDHAFDNFVTNQEMYNVTIKPMVNAFFNKSKCSIFAYGQTGSGKTYTMMGDTQNPTLNPGLYLLAANDIFQLIKQKQFQHLQINVSFYEIYCSKLFDLLQNRNHLQLREDAKQNVNIIGLTERKIETIQDLMQTIQLGMQCRSTSKTSKNDESSRSHAILQICLMEDSKIDQKKLGGAHGGYIQEKPKVAYSKMSFIDLAGSERARDVTDTNKQTRIDGAEINKSLLALKECIRALDMSKNHKPFRGSKLTQVLKDCLTGNCKTVMIGNVSPNLSSSENTLNTLRYSDRVKELKKKNRDELSDPQINTYQDTKMVKENLTDEVSDYENYEFSDQSMEIQEVLDVQQNNQEFQQNNLMENYNNDNTQNFNKNFNQNQQNQFQFQQQNQQNLQNQQTQQNQQNQQIQQIQQNQQNQQNYFQYDNNQNMNFQKNQNNFQDYQDQSNQRNEYFQNNSESQLVQLQAKHKDLVSKIVDEEQNLIMMHHLCITKNAETLKKEQKMLDDLNTQNFDPEQYIGQLDDVLDDKLEMIINIKKQMKSIKSQLKQEKIINLQFQNLKNTSLNIFDVQNQNQGFFNQN